MDASAITQDGGISAEIVIMGLGSLLITAVLSLGSIIMHQFSARVKAMDGRFKSVEDDQKEMKRDIHKIQLSQTETNTKLLALDSNEIADKILTKLGALGSRTK